MPGGRGNIKSSDNPKPFLKGNKAAEKWTEEEALRLADGLINWMKEEDENIFYDDYLFLVVDESKFRGKIYPDLIRHLSNKFSTFSDRIVKAAKIEETKLKKFGSFDKLNASMTKFLLSANYGYTEKTQVESNVKTEISAETARKIAEDFKNELG